MLCERRRLASACACASVRIAFARPDARMLSPCALYMFFCSSFCAVSACCCITFLVLMAAITSAGARISLMVNCLTMNPYGASRVAINCCVRLTTSAFLGPSMSAIGSLPTTSCSACRMDCFT
jgi:hypothetical protein